MNEECQLIDFDGKTLTDRHSGEVTVYVGGSHPEFRTSWDYSPDGMTLLADMPICVFAEEMEGDENFWFDPVDCSPDGVVLLGSGDEVLLHQLPRKEQDWAINQMHMTAFQRTIPYQIKERLLRVYSTRWELYELMAYVPSSMALFDSNPVGTMLLANAKRWRPESGQDLWVAISDFVDGLNPSDKSSILEWLRIQPSPNLVKVVRDFEKGSMLFHELTSFIEQHRKMIKYTI